MQRRMPEHVFLNAVVRGNVSTPVEWLFLLAVGMLWTGEEGEAWFAYISQQPCEPMGGTLIIGTYKKLRRR